MAKPKRVRPHVNPFSAQEEKFFEGFGNANPIMVDVGAYKGEFIYELSEKFPDYNFLVLELRTVIADELKEKFKEKDNCRVFDGDAGRNFKNLLQPCLGDGARIEKIFVNFPDPWFKDRHKKRRFINEKFLISLESWLPIDVKFVFQTDQEFLFEETLEVLRDSNFNNISFFEDSAFGISTDWEKSKMDLGSKIWRCEFSRNENAV